MLGAFDPANYVAHAVVPVVMISALGLLALALYNRLAAIVNRLRALFRERMHDDPDLQRALSSAQRSGDAVALERRIEELMTRQVHHVLRRARLVRLALVFLIGAVMCMALCSLTAGLGTLLSPADYLALGCFVTGQVLLIAGLFVALIELRLALRPLEIESRVVETIRERRARHPSVED